MENILENDNLKKKTYQIKMKTEIFLQQTWATKCTKGKIFRPERNNSRWMVYGSTQSKQEPWIQQVFQ